MNNNRDFLSRSFDEIPPGTMRSAFSIDDPNNIFGDLKITSREEGDAGITHKKLLDFELSPQDNLDIDKGYRGSNLSISLDGENPFDTDRSKRDDRQTDNKPIVIKAKEKVRAGSFLPIMSLIDREVCSVDMVIDRDKGMKLIHYPAYYGKMKALKLAVEVFKCDTNVTNNFLETPIHLAATVGEISSIKYLSMLPGCNMEAKDTLDSTPMLNAVKAGKEFLLIYLYFEKGCKLDVKDINMCSTLHWAAYVDSLDILNLLKNCLGESYNVNKQDKDKMTPIFKAIINRGTDAIRFLVADEECDLFARDSDGNTPKDILMRYYPTDKKTINLLNYNERKKIMLQTHSLRDFLAGLEIKTKFTYIYKYCKDLYSPQIALILLTFSMFTLYVHHLMLVAQRPQYSALHSFIYHFLLLCSILCAFFFYRNSKQNSLQKQAKRNPETSELVRTVLDMISNGDYMNLHPQDELCFACMTIKSKHTEHCKKCKRCIEDMHFHTLGTCIGRNNVYSYFMLLNLLNILLNVYLYLGMRAFSNESAGSNFISKNLDSLFTQVMSNPLVIGVYAIAILFDLYLIEKLIVLSSAIKQNLTVKEMFNKYKYKNCWKIVSDAEKNETKFVPKERNNWKELKRLVKFMCCGWKRSRISKKVRATKYQELVENAITTIK